MSPLLRGTVWSFPAEGFPDFYHRHSDTPEARWVFGGAPEAVCWDDMHLLPSGGLIP